MIPIPILKEGSMIERFLHKLGAHAWSRWGFIPDYHPDNQSKPKIKIKFRICKICAEEQKRMR